MKKLLFILAMLLPALALAQTNLVITGTAPLLNDGTELSISPLAPRRFSATKEEPVTTKIKNHSFQFNLHADGGILYYLSVAKGGSRFFLNPGKADINIADTIARKTSVSGNLSADELKNYDDLLQNDSKFKAYDKARMNYYYYIQKKGVLDDTAANLKNISNKLLPAKNKEEIAVALNWIQQHPNSYINTYILYNQIEYMPQDELKAAFKAMPASITNNVWGNELRYRIDSLMIGATAPVFSEADTSGKQISLASFRGKYVLVDFWASWCVPCRADNPNQVAAMNKFKDKNFTILSVSLDNKKAAWIAAIKHDGLNWTHVSDLNQWHNKVSVSYYVYSIPNNYLLDPDGKIIAKDLHGNDLIATLDKLIK